MSFQREITEYIVAEYLPGTPASELDPSFDLIDSGVVDSLRLLQLIGWLGDRYHVPMDDLEISPDDFRSVDAITSFIDNARRADAATG